MVERLLVVVAKEVVELDTEHVMVVLERYVVVDVEIKELVSGVVEKELLVVVTRLEISEVGELSLDNASLLLEVVILEVVGLESGLVGLDVFVVVLIIPFFLGVLVVVEETNDFMSVVVETATSGMLSWSSVAIVDLNKGEFAVVVCCGGFVVVCSGGFVVVVCCGGGFVVV